MSKSEFDRVYNSGFKAGRESAVTTLALRERYEYLRKGGEWQTYLKSQVDRELYLAGYEDAMRQLGVKP